MAVIEISDFLEFTSKLQVPGNDTVEQSVIYLHYKFLGIRYLARWEDEKKKSNALEELQNEKHFKVIVHCGGDHESRDTSEGYFCTMLKLWVPRHHFLNAGSKITNKHLMKIILDLLKDVNYNEMNYFGRLHRECFHDNIGLIIVMESDFLFITRSKNLMQWFFNSAIDLGGLVTEWANWDEYHGTGANVLVSISKEGTQIETSKNIILSVNRSMPNSPVLKEKGHIMVWEEDLYDPLFLRMLVDQMNVVLCGEN